MKYLVTAVRDLTESCAVCVEAGSIDESIELAREKLAQDEFAENWMIDGHAVNHVSFFSNEFHEPAIGAECVIRFVNEDAEHAVYISFGSFTEHKQHDGFGVIDDHIFYYATTGESELKEMMSETIEGFVVLKYDLVFQWPTQNLYCNNGRLTTKKKRYCVSVINILSGNNSVLIETDDEEQARSQAIIKLRDFDFSDC